jgi:putative ABC transport system permease protein
MQTYPIDMSAMLEGATMMMPTQIKARITPDTYYIGFIPGLLSTVIGAALAGIGIFKRKTSQLFKELEA